MILRHQFFLLHVWRNEVADFFQRTLIFRNFGDSHDRKESAIWSWKMTQMEHEEQKEFHVVKDPQKASLIRSLVFT